MKFAIQCRHLEVNHLLVRGRLLPAATVQQRKQAAIRKFRVRDVPTKISLVPLDLLEGRPKEQWRGPQQQTAARR